MKLTSILGAVIVLAAVAWDALRDPLVLGLPAVSVPLFYRTSVALAVAYLLWGTSSPVRPLVGGVSAVGCLGRLLLLAGYVPASPLRTAWLAVDAVGAVLWLSVTVLSLEGRND